MTTFSPQFIPSLVGSIFTIGMIIYFHKVTSNVLTKVLLLLMGGALLWTGGNFLENIFVARDIKIFWLKVEYIGLITLPVLWFILSLVYMGRGYFLKRNLIYAVFTPAVIILLMIWIPGLTKYVFPEISLNSSGVFPYLELKYGPVFWFAYAHNNIFMLIGTVLFIRQILNVKKDLELKMALMVFAVLIPWISTVLVVFNVFPWIKIDLSPATMWMSIFFLSLALRPFSKVIAAPISRALVLERIEEGIVVIDAGNRIVDHNGSFLKLIGLKKIRYSEPFETICDRINLPRSVLEKKSYKREVVLEVEDQPKVFEIQSHGIKSDKGKDVGAFITVRDITELKKLTEAAFQSVKMESLSILAGGIVHEFNNIMSAVSGYAELARNAAENQKVRDYLKKALAGADMAQKLTEQLVTFSKGGAPVCRETELFPFFQKRIKLFLGKTKVNPVFDIKSDLKNPWIDKGKIGLVFDGIVTNAIEAMPEGGDFEISADNCRFANKRKLLPEGDYVRVSFKDHGKGIPKSVLPKIFDPFFTTKMHGRGLGLASCFSIVEQHGGTIEVESDEGIGSTFSVYLPVK